MAVGIRHGILSLVGSRAQTGGCWHLACLAGKQRIPYAWSHSQPGWSAQGSLSCKQPMAGGLELDDLSGPSNPSHSMVPYLAVGNLSMSVPWLILCGYVLHLVGI